MDQNIKNLFDNAISYWPKEIDVSEKELFQNDGADIRKLTAIHDDIENEMSLANLSCSIMQMDWAIYTALHQLARCVDIIEPHKVDINRVQELYVENSKFT